MIKRTKAVQAALNTLATYLPPLMCLFSQMMLVGSVADLNSGAYPRIYRSLLDLKSLLASSILLVPSSLLKVIKAVTGLVKLA